MSGSDQHLDKGDELEPAIPAHLRVDRTRPLGAPANFKPVTPSFSARFDPDVTDLTMAYYGVQSTSRNAHADRALNDIIDGFGHDLGPDYWDRAEYTDEKGFETIVLVGYWTDNVAYTAFENAMPDGWWHRSVALSGDTGVFRECYTPGVSDTETTFSHPHPEGYSRLGDHMSGETDTHGYWGSARDRIARAQTDGLNPVGKPRSNLSQGEDTFGRRVVVQPHENLCLLRSGQDWTDTNKEERAFYLERVEPLLDIGMREIRDEGVAKGCYFNRYMVLATSGGRQQKTYSLSAWRSLGDIEAWCRAETHLAIFRAGTKHYQTVGKSAKLRLYHEMSVIRAKDQQFEYVNCHAGTGMLNAIR